MLIDLKMADLEEIAKNERLDARQVIQLKLEIPHYDKYFMVKEDENVGFIKIWRQHISDPYLEICLDECDVISLNNGIPIQRMIDFLDFLFEVPQLVRASKKDYDEFIKRGFRMIQEKRRTIGRFDASTLVGVIKTVDKSEVNRESAEYVRTINQSDIPIIQLMFSEGYALRFRAVSLMYSYDPESCFAYDNEEIKGVAFCERRPDELYVHQIFVRKTSRGSRVLKALLNEIQEYALNCGKQKISGTIRGNLARFYDKKLKTEIDISKSQSYYLIRYCL